MNPKQQEHLERAIKANTRYDGRKTDEYREVKVEYGVSSTAEGSAQVTIGDTVVIAGVKLGLEKPYDDSPDQGTFMVDVGLLPLASSAFETGPPSIDSIELSRVTDRGIRESKCIDMSKLCVEKGEKVWSVIVDVSTVNADGNLFDASSLAVMAALKDTRLPEIKDGTPDYKHKTEESLPVTKTPIGVTIFKIGDTLVVDPTAAEEDLSEARLTIATTENGEICAMQKGGTTPLFKDDVVKMAELATKKAADLRKHL